MFISVLIRRIVKKLRVVMVTPRVIAAVTLLVMEKGSSLNKVMVKLSGLMGS